MCSWERWPFFFLASVSAFVPGHSSEVAVTIGVRLWTHTLNNRCFWQCCGRWHNFVGLAFGDQGLSALPFIVCERDIICAGQR